MTYPAPSHHQADFLGNFNCETVEGLPVRVVAKRYTEAGQLVYEAEDGTVYVDTSGPPNAGAPKLQRYDETGSAC